MVLGELESGREHERCALAGVPGVCVLGILSNRAVPACRVGAWRVVPGGGGGMGVVGAAVPVPTRRPPVIKPWVRRTGLDTGP